MNLSFITTKNDIVKFAYQANEMNKFNKQQKIIQKYNGSTFQIKCFQELGNNKVFKDYFTQDLSTLRLLAIFIQLTWDQNILNVEMRSPKDNQNEDSLILGLFIIPNQLSSRLQLFIKCTIMINRGVWIKQNSIQHPFNQLYWNTVGLSQYFLNVLYEEIIVCWKHKYHKIDTITVTPFNLQSNNIIYISENKNIGHNRNITDRQYLISSSNETCSKGQISQPKYLYIGIHSYDGIFSRYDVQTLMNNINMKQKIFFILNNDMTEMSKTRLYKLNSREVQIEEIKIDMGVQNCNIMQTYIENNNENININIFEQPKFWNFIKKQLNCYFNIKKYHFGFVSSSNKQSSFKIPIYKLKCAATNIFFQNSEMLLFVICMSTITVYTGDVYLIIQPGRIFRIDYNSFPHDSIMIISNGHKVSVLMLRTAPYIKLCPTIKFLDLNIELYDYKKPTMVKKKKRKYKSQTLKRPKQIEIENYFSESEVEMEYLETESECEIEYDHKIISQSVLQCDELNLQQDIFGKNKCFKNLQQEILDKKIKINNGLDLTNIQKKKNYLEKLLHIHISSSLAVDIVFYLGNIYEQFGNYNEALSNYKSSLQIAQCQKTYASSVTIQYKYYCLKKLIDTVSSVKLKLVALQLHDCVIIALSNDESSVKIRKKWINHEAVEYELMGAVKCALSLSQYFEDLSGTVKWNGQSLIYYKAAMNILEKIKLIQIRNVSIDSIVDSFNNEKYIFKKCKNQKVDRKRIVQHNELSQYIQIVESIAQNYLQCLIEKFRNKSFLAITNEKLASFVFDEFTTNKNKYNKDFMKYLQMETDCLFEILHNYWCYNDNIFIQAKEMADVYNNYGAFLCDYVNDYYGAILWMEESLELNQNDIITHWNVAEIYEKMSQYATAINCYSKVLELCDKITDKQIMDDAIASIERVEIVAKKKQINGRNYR